jgi:thioredoxin-like negative regulator of GroEL
VNDFNPETARPDALMLLSSHCPHCPRVLNGLAELLKRGVIGRLEAVNIEARPDLAEQYGVRSVPWVRLGEFELEGLHSASELQRWAERAGSDAGLGAYYGELLKRGRLQKVLGAVEARPERLRAVLELLADPDTELPVRIGVNAVAEHFEDSESLRRQLPLLGELAAHQAPHVRADASHLLALARTPDAVTMLRRLADDDPERAVRETAADALQELGQSPGTK